MYFFLCVFLLILMLFVFCFSYISVIIYWISIFSTKKIHMIHKSHSLSLSLQFYLFSQHPSCHSPPSFITKFNNRNISVQTLFCISFIVSPSIKKSNTNPPSKDQNFEFWNNLPFDPTPFNRIPFHRFIIHHIHFIPFFFQKKHLLSFVSPFPSLL